MALRPPTTMARERVCAYGGAGVGKSNDFYTIARLALLTKSDAIFYVIDTDVSAWRMLTDPAFSSLLSDGEPLNIVVHEVEDWDELMAAMVKVNALMRPQDWLMVDMISPCWDWVQAKFTEKVFSKNLDDYFLEARKAAKASGSDGNAFEGWKDWPVINAMYNRFTTLLLKCKGNLYCTAEQKKVGDMTEKDTKAMFAGIGQMPVGQKRTPHIFQTVIHKTKTVRPGHPTTWEMNSTPKDRSRQNWTGEAVGDFAKDYLVKTAGWKLI